MLNVRLRSAVMVACLGLGWMLMAPQAATAQPGVCFYDVSTTQIGNVNGAGASGSLTVSWYYEPFPQFPDIDPLCGNLWAARSNDDWISVRKSEPTLSPSTTRSIRTRPRRRAGVRSPLKGRRSQ